MCVHLAHTSFQFDLKHLNKSMFPHCFKFRECVIFIVNLSERFQSVPLPSLPNQRKSQSSFLRRQVVFESVKKNTPFPLGWFGFLVNENAEFQKKILFTAGTAFLESYSSGWGWRVVKREGEVSGTCFLENTWNLSASRKRKSLIKIGLGEWKHSKRLAF